MRFSKYLKLVTEQDDSFSPFKKRKGEYVISGDRNKLITVAINDKRMISFVYDGPRKDTTDIDGKKIDSVKPGKREKVFPVALGLSKKNNMIVRCWVQPPNVSKTGFNKKSSRDIPYWRTFMVARMRDVKVLDEFFDLKKLTGYNPNDDRSMRVVYKSAKYSDIPKTKPKEKPKPPVVPPKPEVKPTKPEAKPVKPQPTPKPETKPQPTPKPEVKPTKPEPTPKPENKPTETPKLPEVKPKEKPSKTPEKDEKKKETKTGLSEQLIRIKTLMSK